MNTLSSHESLLHAVLLWTSIGVTYKMRLYHNPLLFLALGFFSFRVCLNPTPSRDSRWSQNILNLYFGADWTLLLAFRTYIISNICFYFTMSHLSTYFWFSSPNIRQESFSLSQLWTKSFHLYIPIKMRLFC